MWHLLHNPPSVNYATWWSNTYFSVLRGRMNILGPVRWRRCTVEKAWTFCIRSTGKREQSQFIHCKKCMAVLIRKRRFAVQYAKFLKSIFRLEGRERGGANAMLQYFTGHLPRDLYGIKKSKACPNVVRNCFRINCSLYESQSLGPLDASRPSVFIPDLP